MNSDIEIVDRIGSITLSSLGRILQKHYDDTKLKVVSMSDFEDMSGLNDAFNSTICCFNATITKSNSSEDNSSLYFVVKSPPTLSIVRFMHKMAKPFLFEVSWYLDLATRLEPLEGGRKNPWPDCYHAYSSIYGSDWSSSSSDFGGSACSWFHLMCMFCRPSDHGLIVLQDVRFAQRPYITFDKWAPLSLSHVTLVMKELANFHGRWIRWKTRPQQNDGLTLDRLKQIYNIRSRVPKIMLSRLFKVARRTVSKILKKAGNEEQNNAKISAFMHSTLMDSFLDQPETDIFTLCHGDFWSNNILFSYEEHDTEHEQPLDLMLVDFQMLFYGHPAYDLSYFLSINTDLAFRDAHLKDMLSVYHTQLLKHYLVPEGISYDFQTFMEDYQRYRAIGTVMAFCVMPNIMSTVSINEISSKIPCLAVAELKRKQERELVDSSVESNPKSAEVRKRIVELVHEMSRDGII